MDGFVGFRNRDSGQQEFIEISHIYRVMGCPEEDNLGYALIWLDMLDNDHRPIAILADMDVAEFMKELENRKIYNGSNERKPTRRNHGNQH